VAPRVGAGAAPAALLTWKLGSNPIGLMSDPSVCVVAWLDGEREAFRATLFPEDMKYYVKEAVIARCRDHADTMPHDEWIALLARGGFHVDLGVAYGPKDLVVDALERRRTENPDTYYSLKGVLAVLEADALPIVKGSLEMAIRNIGNGVYADQISNVLADIAPVDAPTLVPLAARVLTSAAYSRVKAAAVAYLSRHHTTAARVLVDALGADEASERDAARAGVAALAEAGHAGELEAAAASEGPQVIAVVRELVEEGCERASRRGPIARTRVGRLYFAAHSSTPLVAGDLAGMADWRGAPEGADEAKLVELRSGKVAMFDLSLRAPEVFWTGDGVILLAEQERGPSLGELLSDDELELAARAPVVETFETLPLVVSSGAIALAIAYNATPVEGADLGELDAQVFDEETTPLLPAAPPTAPLHRTELVVVPVPNGTYELRVGRTEAHQIATIKRVTEAPAS
jgi:hypothetical protein